MGKKSNELERSNLDAYFRTTKPWPPLSCAPGDVVTYTRYWLRSIGAPPTDDLWRQRGTVVELRHGTFALVLFDDETEARLVHRGNLALAGVPSLRLCE